MKKAAWIYTLIVPLFCFASCQKGGVSSTPEESGQSTVSTTPTGDYFFKDGKSDFSLVIPADYSDSVYYAANEIIQSAKQVTGISLPLVLDSEVDYSAEHSYLSLGPTSFLALAGVAVPSSADLNGDGFLFKSVDHSLFIEGANDTGRLYGAFEFEQRFLGVEFLSPDSTYYPSLKEVPFLAIDHAFAPLFRRRNLLMSGTYGSSAKNALYSAHCRFATEYCALPSYLGENNGWSSSFSSPDHNSLEIVNPSDYMDENGDILPQYVHLFAHNSDNQIAYYDGSTISYSKTGAVSLWDICWTDGIAEDGTLNTAMGLSAASVMIEKMKTVVASSKDNYFMIGQMDHPFIEPSPETKAAVAKYGTTGVMIRFINCVAKALQSWADTELNGRKVNIVMFAYLYSCFAPVSATSDGQGGYTYSPLDPSVIPADNLYIRCAPIGANPLLAYSDVRQDEEYQTYFNEWSSLTHHLMLWSYQTDFPEYFLYFNGIKALKQNIRDLEEVHPEYFMAQDCYTEPTQFLQYLHAYIAAKLFWDSSLDVESLTDRFCLLYFGEAATLCRDFLKTFDEQQAYIMASDPLFKSYTLYQAKYWPYRFLEKQVEKCDEALSVIESSNALTSAEKTLYERRIRSLRLYPTYMILRNYDTYFTNADIEKSQYGEAWCEEVEALGGSSYGESTTLRSLTVFREDGFSPIL
jgi:hypothetical protein